MLTHASWCAIGLGLGLGVNGVVNSLNAVERLDRVGRAGEAICAMSHAESTILWGSLGLGVLLNLLGGTFLMETRAARATAAQAGAPPEPRPIRAISLVVLAGLFAGALLSFLARWGMKQSAHVPSADPACVTPHDLHVLSNLATPYAALFGVGLLATALLESARHRHRRSTLKTGT